ncbi:MAG: Crp/Fnr family transcriptional regulator [Pseudomonadota bacterium]|jgi:CRP-like cAMP-binding protein
MDVISITQHRERPSELLRRRLSATLAHTPDGLDACLTLEGPPRSFSTGEKLLPKGSHPKAWLLASGVAGEVRWLSDRRRQVLNLKLPGDILQGDAQEEIEALSAVQVVDAFPIIRAFRERSQNYQPLRQAWVAAARLEQALMRDHVVRLGCMSAYERMAHFLVETHDRLSRIGLATSASLHLPIKQDVVADLMGLSVVHVSRTMQILKREGLAHARSGYVMLPDLPRLAEVCGYESRFASEPPQAKHPSLPAATQRQRVANFH